MRNTISFCLLFTTLFSFSQRVTFEDPDLTFSFEKPEKWEVFDDGYVVKVSPSAQDSATTYFTITYFENAQPFGTFPLGVDSKGNQQEPSYKQTKIAGELAEGRYKDDEGMYRYSYTFMKFGQRFEIQTSSPEIRSNRIFRKIIRSIEIKE